MATLETIANMITVMKAVYPHYLKGSEVKQTATSWADLFRDVPDEMFIPAFRAAVGRCQYPPTPADVNDELRKSVKRGVNPSMMWTECVKACNRANDLRSRFSYTIVETVDGEEITQGNLARRQSRQLFENLPKPVRDYLGSYSAFMQYAMEMEYLDDTGLQIRRRDFEKALGEQVEGADLRELLGLTGDEDRPLLPE